MSIAAITALDHLIIRRVIILIAPFSDLSNVSKRLQTTLDSLFNLKNAFSFPLKDAKRRNSAKSLGLKLP
jgi:hypothetical protein